MGEITVRGSLVTTRYYNNPEADSLAKIDENGQIRHRMGDLGWLDNNGRIWFCGRKNHRVETEEGTLFTVNCEAIFNRHPDVFRSALVGVGPMGSQTPVIIIEKRPESRKSETELRNELLAMGQTYELTKGIQDILFHDRFPVDIRHNSKIFREKLTVWAEQKMGGARETES